MKREKRLNKQKLNNENNTNIQRGEQKSAVAKVVAI